ncbi:protein adenylyltransferase SelO family protein [Photobacterium leiognathi]|uniref:protein adenylyltransferase SelO family protein n=1 Tax=Photobacterium leiognathi TaxID=553611 RepID=UPI0029811999|nr:protein adenylyltransferase SelO family protein [Photobacterium leiognathi]
MNNHKVDSTFQEYIDNFNMILPEASFEPFETYRLKNTELLWVNKALLSKYGIKGTIDEIEKFLLDEYSYVSSDYTISNRLDVDDKKIFLADRYGSRHEVCHGGSARCGFDGRFQVKGVGITPLLSQNMSKTHSNGKLFIDEAISEAIWGEICHKHLPFGSIRTLAIIKTNIKEEFLYLDNRPMKQCALVIREFAIRPAHFERSTFFWPSQNNIHLRDNDSDRVKEAINLLPDALNLTELDKSSGKILFVCLKKMIFLIAKQVAYSRVKGIPHGSLTSSNISIDGRFLDFGTITAVPDFGNYVLSNGVGAVWDDHQLILNWLQNIIVTLNKYTSYEEKISLNEMEILMKLFVNEMDRQENISLLHELNVKNIKDSDLEKAKIIKNKLINTSRTALGDFNYDVFKIMLKKTALDVGLDIGEIKFELRNFRYSSFTILNNTIINKSEYSRDSVSTLINSYC